jgi:hypothetical protein
MEQIASMPAERRQPAHEELEAYLEGRVPPELASRVQVLPAVAHVWDCFSDLDSVRPISAIPVGFGASIPVREALPWNLVGDWLTEHGFTDPWERESWVRPLLRKMDRVYLKHQRAALTKESEAEQESDEHHG